MASRSALNPTNSSTPTWEIIKYLHPYFVQLDYSQPMTKIGVVIGSFLFWVFVFSTAGIVSSYTDIYKSLRVKEKVFWNLAVVRGIFGTFSAIIGGWAVFCHTPMDDDVIFGTTQTSYFATAVTIGFFIFEVGGLALSDYFFQSMSIMLNLHHWMALVGYTIVLYMDAGHMFAAKILLLEMSTPFSALCWALLKCGKERTFLWKANQFLLVHSFHCRSIVECHVIYVSYVNWTYIWANMPLVLFSTIFTQLPIVFFIMTPYWTYKKTAQMFNPVDWNFEKPEVQSEQNGVAKKID